MTNSTTPRDPDAILAAWLEEGPNQLPEPTRRAIAVATRTTHQTRRAFGAPWRISPMNPIPRLAFAIAAVIGLAGAGIVLFSPQNGGPATAPISLPAPSMTQPSLTPEPSAPWQTVSSERFGYTVDIPGTWTPSILGEDLPDHLYPGAETDYGDRWDEPVTRVPWFIVAVREPSPEETLEAWMGRYTADLESECDASEAIPSEIDGEPATIRMPVCLGGVATIEALAAHDGRAFMITLSGRSADSAALQVTFDRILSSFQFTSTAAATPGVFTSTRYGYTLGFPGGIHNLPSEQDWPAGLVPDASSRFVDRFTGKLDDLGSPTAPTYLTGIAAQPLPDGTSGEDWMVDYIQLNWAIYGDTCGGRPEAWVATSVAGASGRQVQTDCGGGPASITAIVFATEETGWTIFGDTPLVEVLRESFQLPG